MAGFKVAGVSKSDGVVKVRFANDITRVKLLAKNGHTDINLIELPEAMEKPAVVKHLMTTDIYQNPEYRQAIDEADEKYSGANVVKAAKAAVVKTGSDKVTKAKATKAVAKTPAKKTATKKATSTVSMDELMARATAAEKAE